MKMLKNKLWEELSEKIRWKLGIDRIKFDDDKNEYVLTIGGN